MVHVRHATLLSTQLRTFSWSCTACKHQPACPLDSGVGAITLTPASAQHAQYSLCKWNILCRSLFFARRHEPRDACLDNGPRVCSSVL